MTLKLYCTKTVPYICAAVTRLKNNFYSHVRLQFMRQTWRGWASLTIGFVQDESLMSDNPHVSYMILLTKLMSPDFSVFICKYQTLHTAYSLFAVSEQQCNMSQSYDGYCNTVNNNEDCGYDGGDCCLTEFYSDCLDACDSTCTCHKTIYSPCDGKITSLQRNLYS